MASSKFNPHFNYDSLVIILGARFEYNSQSIASSSKVFALHENDWIMKFPIETRHFFFRNTVSVTRCCVSLQASLPGLPGRAILWNFLNGFMKVCLFEVFIKKTYNVPFTDGNCGKEAFETFRWASSFQRRIKNQVQHMQRSFFAKIRNEF